MRAARDDITAGDDALTTAKHMTHPLDRPVWHALSSRQAHIAEGDEHARRFAPDFGPFAAARDDSAESLKALAALVPAEGGTLLIQAGNAPLPPGTKATITAQGVQMVAKALAPRPAMDGIERLTEADAPAMRALAALTKPGPFHARTHELGTFWGVKRNGALIAMAGERMQLAGFTEVSGVCTHPDHRGQGYAGQLSLVVAWRIADRGETPFLHAYAANTPAIRLYEQLGFALRTYVNVTVLAPA